MMPLVPVGGLAFVVIVLSAALILRVLSARRLDRSKRALIDAHHGLIDALRSELSAKDALVVELNKLDAARCREIAALRELDAARLEYIANISHAFLQTGLQTGSGASS